MPAAGLKLTVNTTPRIAPIMEVLKAQKRVIDAYRKAHPQPERLRVLGEVELAEVDLGVAEAAAASALLTITADQARDEFRLRAPFSPLDSDE